MLAFDIEVSLVQVIEHEFCSNALEVGVDIEGWHRGALMFVKLGRHGGDIVLAISPPRSRTFKRCAVSVAQSQFLSRAGYYGRPWDVWTLFLVAGCSFVIGEGEIFPIGGFYFRTRGVLFLVWGRDTITRLRHDRK